MPPPQDVSAGDTENSPNLRYAYRASLIGGAQQFELTDDGLSWRVGAKSGLWRYATIASIRLSYRPVSMQSQRYRADIEDVSGQRIHILSTSWQTVALMAPQDADYRAFIVALHQRLKAADSHAALVGGLRPGIHRASLAVLALLAIAMMGLLARAVATGEYAGVLFLLGFAALFSWQTGGFVLRNAPRNYTFDALPKQLLP